MDHRKDVRYRYAGSGSKLFVTAVLPGLFLLCSSPVIAVDGDPEQVRIYQTREERRDAGLKHRFTDWLILSGLLELEAGVVRFNQRDNSSSRHDNNSFGTLQIAAELHPQDWFKVEALYEYDTEDKVHLIDEIFASIAIENAEFEFGKLYLPFGAYYSNFVTGPILEFGETRAEAVLFNYSFTDQIEGSLFAYSGDARKYDDDNDLDWGFAIEGTLNFGTAGFSFISDLADSDEGLLSDEGDRYNKRVSGLSAFGVTGIDPFEMTLEMVWALDGFEELGRDRNKPSAWNVELGFYPQGNFDWSLRLEGSREIEGAPKWRTGASLTWRVTQNATLTFEYLYSRYNERLAADIQERDFDHTHQAGARFSLQF